MPKKALILDLDNTIYPVSSIGERLFRSLFELISSHGEFEGPFEAVRREIMRKPFQKVAAEFNFSESLTRQGINLLNNLAYEYDMSPFPDYAEVSRLPHRKFLVTTGFTVMQQSKVKQLGIAGDFEEIHIVDPDQSTLTKKDVFSDIITRHGFTPTELLVIGDDPESEIQAATSLGIDWVLYDTLGFHPELNLPNKISQYSQLRMFI